MHDDFLRNIKKISQVNNNKYYNWSFLLVVCLVVGIIFLAIMFLGRKSSQKSLYASPSAKLNNVVLQHNLAKLQARIPQQKSRPIIYNKDYLVRQNSPTSMYQGHQSVRNLLQNKFIKGLLFKDSSQNANFANNALKGTALAVAIPHPDCTIAAGEFIHAQLETAINSDLPGMLRAVVVRSVYAYGVNAVLIPAGSRLIGQYSSAVLQGQNRVMVIWDRIILPNGTTISVNSAGGDGLGRAGIGADVIARHFLQQFSQAALLSIIGAGVANYGVSSAEQFNSSAQYRSAIAQAFQQAANNSLQNNLTIKPTLHVHQGANINVFVAQDLSFYSQQR